MNYPPGCTTDDIDRSIQDEEPERRRCSRCLCWMYPGDPDVSICEECEADDRAMSAHDAEMEARAEE